MDFTWSVVCVPGFVGRRFLNLYVVLIFSADFGLSKIIDDQVTMKTVCGTPGYCGELVTHCPVGVDQAK